MKILDRYIIKQFLLTYLFVTFVIVLIICMIDFTEKIDDFHKRNAPMLLILRDYYPNLILHYSNLISPLLVFIATVFFTSRMAAKSEVIAILSSGISFGRMLVPYFIGASILGIVTFFMMGWVIPKADKTRIDFEQKYVRAAFSFNENHVHLKIAPNLYAYMKNYETLTLTGNKFTLERIEGNKLTEKLTADRIVWLPDKKKWTIYNYRLRKINGQEESISYGTQKDTVINLSPKDFEDTHLLNETLTLNELNDHIAKLRSRGSDGIETYLIEKYTRFTQPFAMLILTAIGVIVSARKSRQGVGLQIALGFALAFFYILFYLLSKGIAESGKMPPLLAVWLPNIVFAGVGALLFKTLPR